MSLGFACYLGTFDVAWLRGEVWRPCRDAQEQNSISYFAALPD
jgi:hypothetical protein